MLAHNLKLFVVIMKWIAGNFLPISTSIFLVIPTSAMLLVMLSGMVGAYLKSIKVIQGLKQSLSKTSLNSRDKKWLKRFSKSCSPIKIRIRNSNFLEALTPLNCLNFAFNLSIQILLVG